MHRVRLANLSQWALSWSVSARRSRRGSRRVPDELPPILPARTSERTKYSRSNSRCRGRSIRNQRHIKPARANGFATESAANRSERLGAAATPARHATPCDATRPLPYVVARSWVMQAPTAASAANRFERLGAADQPFIAAVEWIGSRGASGACITRPVLRRRDRATSGRASS